MNYSQQNPGSINIYPTSVAFIIDSFCRQKHIVLCILQVLLGELQSTESWLNKHISDFSGFHYRQFLLTTLGTQSENLKEQFSIQYIILVQKEFQSILDQVVTFPGHEALWNHRFVKHLAC